MRAGGSLRAAALSLLLVSGCGGASEAPLDVIDFNADDEGGRVRTLSYLDDPFSADETATLREGFDWATTEALPETDEDGHPALRYALVYLTNDAERALLDTMGPHSPLPLFAVERERWRNQVGTFAFRGDGEGLFHFAALPAATYNALREVALDRLTQGEEPPFRAVVLQPIPVAEAANTDGTVDLAWAFAHGLASDDLLTQATDGLRTEPLLELLLLAAFSREAWDQVEGVAADVTSIGRATTMDVQVQYGSTDPSFTELARAWGRGAGTPIRAEGIELVALLDFGKNVARTADNGIAHIDVAEGAAVQFCVRAANEYVQVDEGFEASSQCDFRMSTGLRLEHAIANGRVGLLVTDPIWNIVAQFTDSAHYAEQAMGYHPHRADVLVGPFADLFGSANGNRAFALCGSFLGTVHAYEAALGALTGALLPLDPQQLLLAKILSHDVIFPNHGDPGDEFTGPSATYSRVVPTHEYGHFVQCSIVSDAGGMRAFNRTWEDVILTALTTPPSETTENLYLTEGLADYFALQVAGG